MGVSVLNEEGLLIIAVASRSIMIVGAEHVPQGLSVWLMLLHQACLCYLSLLPMLQTFFQSLLMPSAKKCHYLQLLSRPKMASHLVVWNLKMTASRPLFVKTTRPLGIIVRPPLAMTTRLLGITLRQPLAMRCLRIVSWHGLMASLTYLRWKIYFSYQAAKFKDIKVDATLHNAQEELIHHIKKTQFSS
jgi:hypothetical protein